MTSTTKSNASLLTVKDIATMLGCSTKHVENTRDRGDMPASFKIGSLVRWRAGDIDRWIAAGCPKAATESTGA